MQAVVFGSVCRNDYLMTTFDMGDEWDKYKKKNNFTDPMMFEKYNKPALNYAMRSNMEIRFTDNPLAEENIGTFLHKEYQYLLDNKYGTGLQNTKDGWILVRNK